ncbi:MAG: TIGR03086 family metal-binding protein [Actinomycetota bacterium]
MTDFADRHRRLATRFSAVIADVGPDAWDSPSPCEGWSARDVVAHVADTQLELVERLGLGSGDGLSDDPLARWSAVTVLVQGLLDDPATADHGYDGFLGPTTFAETIDRYYSFDLVVHAWDLARAAGLDQHEPIEPGELDRIRADADSMGEMLRSPGICGPPVAVDAAASPQDRLLAHLGRRP